MNKRGAGILMSVTSLPSNYGIGTMGQAAKKFVDFLVAAGQSYWQILPLGPTGYGDSPYQSFSSFAGNPYLIDLDELNDDGLLNKTDYDRIPWCSDNNCVDYGALYKYRIPILAKAANKINENLMSEYLKFLNDNKYWLEDFSLFMAEKKSHNGREWQQWEDNIRLRDLNKIESEKERLAEEIELWKRLQFLFYRQWMSLREYANSKGVMIIGDIPLYVSSDSADVWANPEQFRLNDNRKQDEVAGVPPDGFSADGQKWGNPLFNWELMIQQKYSWWTKRISFLMKLTDYIRIDHFRGFESYFVIDDKENTARNGHWEKGPGLDFFRTLKSECGNLNIIAEDLGYLTPEVIKLVNDTNYPGMKVLQFAFDNRDTGTGYAPHTYPVNCIAYTGTHDNDTVLGWMSNAPEYCVNAAKEYLNLTVSEGYNWGFIRGVYQSVSMLAIIPFQDIAGLGSEARMNTPSTTGNNWKWRAESKMFTEELSTKLHHWTEMYGRLNRNDR